VAGYKEADGYGFRAGGTLSCSYPNIKWNNRNKTEQKPRKRKAMRGLVTARHGPSIDSPLRH
jgi:hypothetical protein